MAERCVGCDINDASCSRMGFDVCRICADAVDATNEHRRAELAPLNHAMRRLVFRRMFPEVAR